MPISVSIVEDNQGTRDGLVDLLTHDSRLRLVGIYPNGEAAVRAIPAEKPDVALIDINLPGMSGIECVARLKGRVPNLAILMLTAYEESDLIFDSLRAGAKGYLLKKMPPEELISAIEQVYAGGAPMSMKIARKVVDYFGGIQQTTRNEIERLTPREHEILSLLAKGYRYKEICDQLGFAMGTMRTHIQTIYDKLQVQSRTEAALKFLGR